MKNLCFLPRIPTMSGVVTVVGDVCAQASNLVGLSHEHLMPEGTQLPAGLGARVAAFGLGGKRMVVLVAESVVSGSSTALVVLMGHGVSIDDSLVETIPVYTDEQSK